MMSNKTNICALFREGLVASVNIQSAVRENRILVAHIGGEMDTQNRARDNQPSGVKSVNEKLVFVVKTFLQVDILLIQVDQGL